MLGKVARRTQFPQDTRDAKLLASVKLDAGIYAVSYKPDGSLLAAAGEDGRIRLINPKDAKVVEEFMPVKMSATAATAR